ncbi:hypothetical protein PoMZ_09496, partial [Pyricularia oryzae]
MVARFHDEMGVPDPRSWYITFVATLIGKAQRGQYVGFDCARQRRGRICPLTTRYARSVFVLDLGAIGLLHPNPFLQIRFPVM